MDARPERLALLLGYGPNPYETAAARALTEALTQRLGHGIMAIFGPDASKTLQRLIADAVTEGGLHRELVVLFSMVPAFLSAANKIVLNPPDADAFDHIQPDTLRRFRAHLWDTADIGNGLSRTLLDQFRADEIKRRRG